MKRFLRRRVEHCRRHWYSYGLGAVVAGAFLTWATLELCAYAKAKTQQFHSHYLQSEVNAKEIYQLKLDYLNLSEKLHRCYDTNRLQNARISALEETNKNLKWWVNKLRSR